MSPARAWLAAALLVGTACTPASAQSLRIGEAIRLSPSARLHADVRQTRDGEDVELDVARRRVGVSGRVTSHVEFEVERELDGAGGWRDVFVNVRATRALQLRAGHFKVPFSRDQLTGAGSLDFIDRSRAADLLAPGRSIGVALHGRLAGRVAGYEVGAFVRDGTHGRLAPTASEPTVAGRVRVKVTSLEIGAAVAGTGLEEGRTSLRGRLTTKDTFFAPVFVSGSRLRVGGDLDWRPGPFGLRAEFLRADDARHHQGLAGETLPPLRAQGWHISGVWALAGRKAHARANDRFAVAGVNGLELALRAEQISFGTPGASEPSIWTPRAERISAVTERAWTVGVNWTVNRLVRVQANAVRENVVGRAPIASWRAAWSPALRLQVAM
jgi:phosphate-selective porin